MSDDKRLQADIDALAQHGGNKTAAAKSLGMTRSSFRRLIDRGEVSGVVKSADAIAPSKESFTFDQTQNTTHIHSVSGKVKTVAEAIAKAEVDLSIWSIDRFLINSWEVGTKDRFTSVVTVTPLWQVKVWLKRQVPSIVEVAGESLIKRIQAHAPKYQAPPRQSRREDAHLLEVSLHDAHIGKKAWARETGQNQDLDIISMVLAEAIDETLDKIGGFNVARVCLPIGNDFLHINNPEAASAKGTPQDVDDRLSKIFETGCLAMVNVIDRCLGVAPVDLIFVPGNHDRDTSWFLIQYLKAWYHKSKHVTVNDSPRQRKFLLYGPTLIGFTHGNEEPHRDLPAIMAGEVPDLWAKSEFREWHVGHVHKQKQTNYSSCDTHVGVVVRVLPSLSATDRWHYSKGYINSRRSAESFLYSRQDGPVGSFSANVREGAA